MDQFKEIINAYFENYSKFEKGKVTFDCDYGELIFNKENDNCLTIYGIYIFPEYRNKGVGKLLIQAALDSAKDCKLKEVYLACFEDLIFYYKKLNFNYTGNQIFYANKKYYIFKYKL